MFWRLPPVVLVNVFGIFSQMCLMLSMARVCLCGQLDAPISRQYPAIYAQKYANTNWVFCNENKVVIKHFTRRLYVYIWKRDSAIMWWLYFQMSKYFLLLVSLKSLILFNFVLGFHLIRIESLLQSRHVIVPKI